MKEGEVGGVVVELSVEMNGSRVQEGLYTP